ncbi:MAG TPA: septum site-determining protein Ssd [Mycobacteriales bacterium]|nr:septum site-determining protein Ssd [Mycobacteriales bacterium]
MAGALLVTARDGLAANVGRLAALAGSRCELQRDSSAVRGAWRQAAVVLAGADVVVALAAAGLPRRDRVVVVADGEPDGRAWQAALALGAHRLIRLPADEAELVEELRGCDRPLGTSGRVIGVFGGCGGAGTSTFSAALAMTAAARSSAVLIDGDPLGGGLDVLLGAEASAGLRWGDVITTRGRLDPDSFAGALCRVGSTAVLAWGRSDLATSAPVDPAAIDAVTEAAKRSFATVVVDLPRSGGVVAERLLDAVDETVLIVPAEVRPVAAACSLLAALGDRALSPRLVVRDAGGANLPAGDVGASLGLEVVAALRTDPAVRQAAVRGEPPLRGGRGSLASACAAVLSAVGAAAVAA